MLAPGVVFDVAAAAVLSVSGVVSTVGTPGLSHPAAEVLVAIWMAAVALRTRAPLATAVLTSAGAVGYAAVGAQSTPLWSFVALLLVAFAVGVGLSGGRRVLGAILLLAGIYVLQVVAVGRTGGSFSEEYLSPPILVGAPVVAGALVQRWREQAARFRRMAEELEIERRHHVLLAVHEERRRIARDLHDVISHSVSSMVVQAGAAGSLVDPGHPVAGELQAIRRTGREALAQLREQLCVLREGRDPAELDESARPDPDPLSTLPAYVREAGAVYHQEGDPTGVPERVRLAAVRVVREGIANVQRHAAGASAEVAVTRRDHEFEVTVTDGGGHSSGEVGAGFGLRGLQELVQISGGRWLAGPHAGGWRICAVFPLGHAGRPQ